MILLTLRYTRALEMATDNTTPASKNHGEALKYPSAHRPRNAKRTMGIAIVYPSSHANCHAPKFGSCLFSSLFIGDDEGGGFDC